MGGRKRRFPIPSPDFPSADPALLGAWFCARLVVWKARVWMASRAGGRSLPLAQVLRLPLIVLPLVPLVAGKGVGVAVWLVRPGGQR